MGIDKIVYIGLGISATVVLVLLIPVVLQLKKTIRGVDEFLKKTEDQLDPVLAELQDVLAELKTTTNNINTVTSNARELSQSVLDLSYKINSISTVISDLQKETNATVAGLKAGVKTAVGVFVKNLTRKGG